MLFGIVQGMSPSAIVIFTLGTRGIVLGRKNIIITLTSIELMLLAVNPNPPIPSVYIDDLIGQSFASLTSTVAAAESAIGLAIPVIHPRIRGTISVQYIHSTKGQRNDNEIYKRIRASRTTHAAVCNHHTSTSILLSWTNYSYSHYPSRASFSDSTRQYHRYRADWSFSHLYFNIALVDYVNHPSSPGMTGMTIHKTRLISIWEAPVTDRCRDPFLSIYSEFSYNIFSHSTCRLQIFSKSRNFLRSIAFRS